jgi:hypothetical protein
VNEKFIQIWLAGIGIASVGAIGMTLAPSLRAQSPTAAVVPASPLSAVVTPAPPVQPAAAPAQPDYFLRAQQVMSEGMRDPDSVKFRNLFEGNGLSGRKTVCGEVNAKNGFGGYTGMKPFIYFADTNEATDVDIVSETPLNPRTASAYDIYRVGRKLKGYEIYKTDCRRP